MTAVSTPITIPLAGNTIYAPRLEAGGVLLPDAPGAIGLGPIRVDTSRRRVLRPGR